MTQEHETVQLQEEDYSPPWARAEADQARQAAEQQRLGALEAARGREAVELAAREAAARTPLGRARGLVAGVSGGLSGLGARLGSVASNVFPISAGIVSAPLKLVGLVAGEREREKDTAEGTGSVRLLRGDGGSVSVYQQAESAKLVVKFEGSVVAETMNAAGGGAERAGAAREAAQQSSSNSNSTMSMLLSTVGSIAPGARLLFNSVIAKALNQPPDIAPLPPPPQTGVRYSSAVQVLAVFDEESPAHNINQEQPAQARLGWWPFGARQARSSRGPLGDSGASEASSASASAYVLAEERAAAEALSRYDPAASSLRVPFPLMTEDKGDAAVAPPGSSLPLSATSVAMAQAALSSLSSAPPEPARQVQAQTQSQTQQGQGLAAAPAAPSFISQLPAVRGFLPSINFNVPTIPIPNMTSLGTSTLNTITSAYGKSMGYGSIPPMGPVDSSLTVRMGGQEEMRTMPGFVDEDRVPLPTVADFDYIYAKKVNLAVASARNIQSEADADEFLGLIGLQPLLTALLIYADDPEMRGSAIRGICALIRRKKSVAGDVAENQQVLSVLSATIEAPMWGFMSFRSQEERSRQIRNQVVALALVQRMVRSSDRAVAFMSQDARLKKVLLQLVAQGSVVGYKDAMDGDGLAAGTSLSYQAGTSSVLAASGKKRSMNATTIIDFNGLQPHQMARVASWGLGGVQWKPRQPGQKGLRILSLDGGGTKGVLSIALLKEIMDRAGSNKPHEMFDIICGTSTGGIIAVVMGMKRKTVNEMETLYDDFVAKVFGKGSQFKLGEFELPMPFVYPYKPNTHG